jgi:hypothetical protein
VGAKASSTAGSSRTPASEGVRAFGRTSDADTLTALPANAELRPGDAVNINGRAAFFLYRRGTAAVVRFRGERITRVVPFTKLAFAGGTSSR